MSSDHVIQVGDDTFETQVLNSDLPVLVDFWAIWCGPCKAIAPIVEKLAGEFEGKVRVAKVDVDRATQVARTYKIRSIPTLLVFKGGDVVDTVVGAVPEARLRGLLQAHI
jgi:thioredoxin 1